MKTVTLRNLSPRLAVLLRRKALEEGPSVSKVVLRLLERALGLQETKAKVVHHDLDDPAGSWSAAEAKAIEEQRTIDGSLWK
jgi:hypothetical protein